MKIKLVLKDWTKKGKPLTHVEALGLSMHDFHAGSAFDGNIQVDPWQEKELREAIAKGYQPVFCVF